MLDKCFILVNDILPLISTIPDDPEPSNTTS